MNGRFGHLKCLGRSAILTFMRRETWNFIKKYHMVDPGDRIVIGLSGGADSVCLLHLLWCLREELGIALFAVHVHHGIRGPEADRDARFSEEFCRRFAVPCRVEHICAEQEAAVAKISVEEAGRQARYRIFEAEARRIMAECGGSVKIATAHHGNDSAETILFHLFRGSGLKGLGGIAPVRGLVIRPILWAEREQILSYLSDNSLPFVEDSTNAGTDYTRNKIRNLILPTAVSEINCQAVQNILRAGEWIAGADRYLERQAVRWLEEHGRPEECGRPEEHRQPEEHGRPEEHRQPEVHRQPEGSPAASWLSLPVVHLKAEEPILQGYILRLALKELGSPSRDITAVHIADILSLLDKQTGKRVALPYGLCAVREYDRLCLVRGGRERQSSVGGMAGGKHFPAPVQSISPGTIPPEGLILAEGPLPGLRLDVFPCENPGEFPKNQYTKWFDYDKIKDTLSVRYRQKGDYITLPTGGRKTLKAFFVDEKIPRQQREEIPLLAEGSHVLWIAGLRISEYYKITEHTEMVLRVQLDGGTNGG